ELVTERFDGPDPGWGPAAAGAAVLLALCALVGLRARRRGRALLATASSSVPMLALSWLVVLADAIVVSRAHPLLVDHRGLQTTIETEDEVVARLRRAAPRPDHRRLVCLGSSQTWGAGARRADEAWPARLERLLNRSLRPGERPWAC